MNYKAPNNPQDWVINREVTIKLDYLPQKNNRFVWFIHAIPFRDGFFITLEPANVIVDATNFSRQPLAIT